MTQEEIKESPVATSDAVVVTDQPVTMYKGDDTVTVSSRAVSSMQRDGWLLRSAEEVPGLVNEIGQFCDQLKTNITQLADAVTSDGKWDPHDGTIYASSLVTRRMLDERISSLLDLLHTAYPRAEDEANTATHPESGESFAHDPTQTPMVDPEGNARAVDPAQVEHLTSLGWKAI